MLDSIQDDTVPILGKDVLASRRIEEVTMKKIHASDTPTETKGRTRRNVRIAVLAAAILLVLSVTALAAGRFWHTVNFDGEEIGGIEEPMATVPPDAEVIEPYSEAQYEEAAAILSQGSADELVIIRWEDGSCESCDRSADIASTEELKKLLAEDGSVLTMPFTIPEGFSFAAGHVSYQAAEGNGYTLVSTEQRDGFAVERYAVPEEGNFISAYTLVFVDASGTELNIYAQMQDEAEHGFGAEDGDRIETFSAEGMEKALLIGSSDHAAVFLLQPLAEPIPYTSSFRYMDENLGGSDLPQAYTKVIYEAYLYGTDADMLLEMTAP